jgi:hypothetical protein
LARTVTTLERVRAREPAAMIPDSLAYDLNVIDGIITQLPSLHFSTDCRNDQEYHTAPLQIDVDRPAAVRLDRLSPR